MGDVGTGHYNSSGDTKCEAQAGKPVIMPPVDNAQGTNGDCMFLGQVMIPAADGHSFNIYSVIGLRTKDDGTEVTKYSEAVPTVFKDTVDNYSINGADFKWIKYEPGGIDTSPKSIGFLTSLGSYNPSGDLMSGSGNTNVFAINHSDVPNIEMALGHADTVPAPIDIAKNPSKVMICIDDGARNAVITIIGGSTSTVIGQGGCPV